MSIWEIAYLVKEKSVSSDAGTLYVDLPSNEPISAILLDLQVTAGAAASVVGTRCVLDEFTDIQVLLEGAKTAFKASSWVASGMAFFPERKLPPHKLSTRGFENCRVPLYFGRKPRDKEYLLDTSLYSSAQLQIVYNMNTTYCTTGSLVYSVAILRPKEKLAVKGFVRSRVINTWTSSGSAEYRQQDLPIGLPWQRVGCRFYDADGYRYLGLLDVDFTVDSAGDHLFNGRCEDLRQLQGQLYGWDIPGPISEHNAADGDSLYTFMGETRNVNLLDRSANPVVLSADSIKSDTMTIKWPSVSNETLAWQCFGSQPYGNIVLFEGEDEPFDAPAHSDAMIEYSLGAYAQQIETWMQEIVKGAL